MDHERLGKALSILLLVSNRQGLILWVQLHVLRLTSIKEYALLVEIPSCQREPSVILGCLEGLAVRIGIALELSA